MRKIKKMIVPMLAVMVLSGCNKDAKDASQVINDNAMEIISTMAEKAGSVDYINAFTNYNEIGDMGSQIAEGDYSTPANIYKLTFTSEGTKALFDLMDTEISGNLSENLKGELEDKMIGTIATMLNSGAGTKAIVLSSVIQTEAIFVCEEMTENCLYMYFFENGFPVCVAFTPGKDGAVLARGVFLVREDFVDMDAAKVEETFKEMAQYAEYEFEIIK